MFDFLIVWLLSTLACVLSVAGLVSGRAGAVMARPLEQAAPNGGRNAGSAVANKAVTNRFTVQPAFDLLGAVCGGLLERLAGWRSHASKRAVFLANQVGVARQREGEPLPSAAMVPLSVQEHQRTRSG
jgi:hypothetical protein